MNLILLSLLLLLQVAAGAGPAVDNAYVRVFRNSARCAAASAACGERVLVALSPMELNGKKMARGEVQAFSAGESYAAPKSGEFLEVSIKPDHPKFCTMERTSPSSRKRCSPANTPLRTAITCDWPYS
jgi:hypothetical protein